MTKAPCSGRNPWRQVTPRGVKACVSLEICPWVWQCVWALMQGSGRKAARDFVVGQETRAGKL